MENLTIEISKEEYAELIRQSEQLKILRLLARKSYVDTDIIRRILDIAPDTEMEG